jgi:sigma-B regulation protein RsbU (phosphoserine phosphatase)
LNLEKDILNLKVENKRVNEVLDIHKEKILSLSNLTESINRNFSSKEIVAILEKDLKSLMKVSDYTLFVKKTEWELLLNEGIEINLGDVNFEIDFRGVNSIQKISKQNNFKLSQFDCVIPVFHKTEPLAFLFLKDINIDSRLCGNKEAIGYIETVLNLTVISLENKKLSKKLKSRTKIQEEMDLAAEVQKELIPSNFPKNPNFEFHGKYIPFESVGGDYYDLIKIDEDNIAFCICDVSGKGISAGMLMSSFQATLRTLLSRKLDLIELVKSLNTKFLNITKQARFISMFIGKYNIKTRKLEFINAGHNPPVLKNNDKVKLLETGSCILGAIEELPFIESEEVYLENDAILVMYTDGFSEIENEFGVEFGVENITKLLLAHKNKPLRLLLDHYMKSIHKYRGENAVFDDISLLCAKFPSGK